MFKKFLKTLVKILGTIMAIPIGLACGILATPFIIICLVAEATTAIIQDIWRIR